MSRSAPASASNLVLAPRRPIASSAAGSRPAVRRVSTAMPGAFRRVSLNPTGSAQDLERAASSLISRGSATDAEAARKAAREVLEAGLSGAAKLVILKRLRGLFPINGLDYTAENAAYKASIDEMVRAEERVSRDSFARLEGLGLVGIRPIDRTVLSDVFVRSRQSRGVTSYFKKSVTASRGGRPLSKSTAETLNLVFQNLAKQISEAKTPEDLSSVVLRDMNFAGDTGEFSSAIGNILNSVRTSVSARCAGLPIAFVKYVLQCELELVKDQLVALSGFQVSTRDGLTISETIFAKAEDYTPQFREAVKFPISVSLRQIDAKRRGAINIALIRPATEPFISDFGIGLGDDVCLSTDQLSAMRAIDHAIHESKKFQDSRLGEEPVLRAGKGGKAAVRIGTGGGKTYLSKLIRDRYLGAATGITKTKIIDLNSSERDLAEVFDHAGAVNFSGTLVMLDEAFFYDFYDHKKFFLPGEAVSAGASASRTEGIAILESDISSAVEVARRFGVTDRGNPLVTEIAKDIAINRKKNEAIKEIRRRGGTVIIFGASESLDKIESEIQRMQLKLGNVDAEIAKFEAKKQALSTKERSKTLVIKYLSRSPLDVGLLNKEKCAVIFNPLSRAVLAHQESILAEYDAECERVLESGAELVVNPEKEAIRELCNQLRSVITSNTPYTDPRRINILKAIKEKVPEYNEGGLPASTRPAGAARSVARLRRDMASSEEGFSIASEEENLDFIETRLDELKSERLDRQAKIAERESKLRELTARRDKKSTERLGDVDAAIVVNPVIAAGSNPSIADLVTAHFSSNQLRDNVTGEAAPAGERVQYVLPDFEFSEANCTAEHLRSIAAASRAEIIFFPTTTADGKFAYGVFRASTGEKLIIPTDPENALDDFITANVTRATKMITFFDRRNAVGGDYSKASTLVARQVVHVTKGLDGKGAGAENAGRFTKQNLSQAFGRDRTGEGEFKDRDGNPIKVATHFVLHDARVGLEKAEIISEIERNTQIEDRVRDVAYLVGKIATSTSDEKRKIYQSVLERRFPGLSSAPALAPAAASAVVASVAAVSAAASLPAGVSSSVPVIRLNLSSVISAARARSSSSVSLPPSSDSFSSAAPLPTAELSLTRAATLPTPPSLAARRTSVSSESAVPSTQRGRRLSAAVPPSAPPTISSQSAEAALATSVSVSASPIISSAAPSLSNEAAVSAAADVDDSDDELSEVDANATLIAAPSMSQLFPSVEAAVSSLPDVGSASVSVAAAVDLTGASSAAPLSRDDSASMVSAATFAAKPPSPLKSPSPLDKVRSFLGPRMKRFVLRGKQSRSEADLNASTSAPVTLLRSAASASSDLAGDSVSSAPPMVPRRPAVPKPLAPASSISLASSTSAVSAALDSAAVSPRGLSVASAVSLSAEPISPTGINIASLLSPTGSAASSTLADDAASVAAAALSAGTPSSPARTVASREPVSPELSPINAASGDAGLLSPRSIAFDLLSPSRPAASSTLADDAVPPPPPSSSADIEDDDDGDVPPPPPEDDAIAASDSAAVAAVSEPAISASAAALSPRGATAAATGASDLAATSSAPLSSPPTPDLAATGAASDSTAAAVISEPAISASADLTSASAALSPRDTTAAATGASDLAATSSAPLSSPPTPDLAATAAASDSAVAAVISEPAAVSPRLDASAAASVDSVVASSAPNSLAAASSPASEAAIDSVSLASASISPPPPISIPADLTSAAALSPRGATGASDLAAMSSAPLSPKLSGAALSSAALPPLSLAGVASLSSVSTPISAAAAASLSSASPPVSKAASLVSPPVSKPVVVASSSAALPSAAVTTTSAASSASTPISAAAAVSSSSTPLPKSKPAVVASSPASKPAAVVTSSSPTPPPLSVAAAVRPHNWAVESPSKGADHKIPRSEVKATMFKPVISDNFTIAGGVAKTISHVWDGDARGNNFRVIDGVYTGNEDEQKAAIAKTFLNIIAVAANQEGLTIDQVKRAIEIAKRKGGVAHEKADSRYEDNADISTDPDAEKLQRFSAVFQKLAALAGIYTGRQSTRKNVKPVGLRLTFLPESVVDDIDSIDLTDAAVATVRSELQVKIDEAERRAGAVGVAGSIPKMQGGR